MNNYSKFTSRTSVKPSQIANIRASMAMLKTYPYCMDVQEGLLDQLDDLLDSISGDNIDCSKDDTDNYFKKLLSELK